MADSNEINLNTKRGKVYYGSDVRQIISEDKFQIMKFADYTMINYRDVHTVPKDK